MKYLVLLAYLFFSSCGYDKKSGYSTGDIQIYQSSSLLDLRYHLNQKGIDGLFVTNIKLEQLNEVWRNEYPWSSGDATPMEKVEQLVSKKYQEDFKDQISLQLDDLEDVHGQTSSLNNYETEKDGVKYKFVSRNQIQEYHLDYGVFKEGLILNQDLIVSYLRQSNFSLLIEWKDEMNWQLQFQEGSELHKIISIDNNLVSL
jgi:hypothetical protein